MCSHQNLQQTSRQSTRSFTSSAFKFPPPPAQKNQQQQPSAKMCFVNQSICSGCETVTETPTPKKPSARCPDVLQYGCSGKKEVVKVERTGPEFCTYCYFTRHEEIKKKWEGKVEAVVKQEGVTPAQVDEVRRSCVQRMEEEVVLLDREWEKMWTA